MGIIQISILGQCLKAILLSIVVFIVLSASCAAQANNSLYIRGVVFNDVNSNGVRDNGEWTLPNWEINISPSIKPPQGTDEFGKYSFNNLSPGKYDLNVVVKPGQEKIVTVTQPDGGTFSRDLSENESKGNFGLHGALYISGTVYHDSDSNGTRESGEQGLEGKTIKLSDSYGNEYQDQTTDKSGTYTFANLLPGIYIVKESTDMEWAYTSPPSGKQLVALTNDSEPNINFGNKQDNKGEATDGPGGPNNLAFGIMIIIALALFGGGAFVIHKGISDIDAQGNFKKNAKCMTMSGFGLILVLMGFYLLSSLLSLFIHPNSDLPQNSFGMPMWFMVLICLMVFIILVGIGVYQPGTMETGQMRRAIAGTLIFGFVVVLLFALYGGINGDNREIVIQYIQLVGIIIGFYFGSKIVEEVEESKEKTTGGIKINSVTFDGKEGSLTVNLTNDSAGKTTVDRIYVYDPEGNMVGQITGLKRDISAGESPVVFGKLKYSEGSSLKPGVNYTTRLAAPDGETIAQLTSQIIPPEPDLKITKTASPETLNVSDKINYLLKVTNNGPITAKDVKVTDKVPNGTAFVSAASDKGSYDQNTEIWTIGDLAAGSTATLTLVVQAETAGLKTNTAEAFNNNTATATATVLEPPPPP